MTSRFSSLWFCFRLWSGCENLHNRLWRLFFSRSAGTSVLLYFESITNLFDPWEILTQDWELSWLRDQILISIAIQTAGCDFQYGSNSCVSLNPSFWLWWLIIFWKSVFTTGSRKELFFNVFSHEILSDFNNIHESCIHTKLTICLVVITFQFVLSIFAIEDLCDHDHHNLKARLSWSPLARMRNSIVLPQRVAPFYQKKFRILHTFLRLLRKDWADLQK